MNERTIVTPIGELTVIAHGRGVVAVLFDGEQGADRSIATTSDPDADTTRVLDDATRQLAEYFDGARQEFDLPLDPSGTGFQQSAWTALRSIPFGATISYGEQAARMGDRRKARAVGAANGRNPIPIIVPCHRVVGSNGSLTGFAGGLDTKAWLLDHERAVLHGA
jgi:methylated-DNA-[protein]-cysteine S-methyltransferase